jgi:transposase
MASAKPPVSIHGIALTKVASSFKVNYKTVSRWLKDFEKSGIQGLKDKPRSGRKCKFKYQDSDKLKADIEKLSEDRDGGSINGKDIQKLLKEKYNADYKQKSVYELLHRIGMTWVSCRSKHPNADTVKQEYFKKTLNL